MELVPALRSTSDAEELKLFRPDGASPGDSSVSSWPVIQLHNLAKGKNILLEASLTQPALWFDDGGQRAWAESGTRLVSMSGSGNWKSTTSVLFPDGRVLISHPLAFHEHT